MLWKLSQKSEYRDIQQCGKKVIDWITLGDPLGEPGVRKNLYDAREHDDAQLDNKSVAGKIACAVDEALIIHSRAMLT